MFSDLSILFFFETFCHWRSFEIDRHVWYVWCWMFFVGICAWNIVFLTFKYDFFLPRTNKETRFPLLKPQSKIICSWVRGNPENFFLTTIIYRLEQLRNFCSNALLSFHLPRFNSINERFMVISCYAWRTSSRECNLNSILFWRF